MNTNGTYTYMPPLNFSGIDTFTYTATDSAGNSTTSIVTITVFPKAANNAETTNANTPLNGPTLFDPFCWKRTFDNILSKSHKPGGRVTVNPDGTYLYDPPAIFQVPILSLIPSPIQQAIRRLAR